MGSARKYLALALSACKLKQFEEAGIFLAQAAASEDAETVAEELGACEDPKAPEVELEGNETESTSSSGEDTDLEWDDEPEDEDSVSSSVTRRRHTSLFHIGKILAASMSAGSDDEDDEVPGKVDEVDPDFPGETLVPASFSSVKVKAVTPPESD